MAWFWFSGFPSPSFTSPGNLMEYISWKQHPETTHSNPQCIDPHPYPQQILQPDIGCLSHLSYVLEEETQWNRLRNGIHTKAFASNDKIVFHTSKWALHCYVTKSSATQARKTLHRNYSGRLCLTWLLNTHRLGGADFNLDSTWSNRNNRDKLPGPVHMDLLSQALSSMILWPFCPS